MPKEKQILVNNSLANKKKLMADNIKMRNTLLKLQKSSAINREEYIFEKDREISLQISNLLFKAGIKLKELNSRVEGAKTNN